MRQIIFVSNGYNGHMEKLYMSPIKNDRAITLLRRVAPDKECMIRRARKSNIEKAIEEQS